MNSQTPKHGRPATALGILLIAATVATTADARPIWRHVDYYFQYGEPTSGEGYYPGIACAAGQLTVVVEPDHLGGLHQNHDLEWTDARGHHGPWPQRVTVRSGQLSTAVTGELDGENFGFPEVRASVPAASPVGRAILATGVVDASVRGWSMHAPPIPRPLLTRLAADCRGPARG